ncbi:putative ATP-binding cassette sub-family C member 13 [Amphiura filiformis]|uniref:putative ATP-binding cassette sub-family C member 13 n=1 Tax=Amphiura filiformis TaxID=82378 RepID=UPI003B223A80
MVLVLFSYAMYICMEIFVIAKKVFYLSIPKPNGIKPNMKYHQDNASMFSSATFLWFDWVFHLGYKRPLEMDDLGCLPKQFTSKFNHHRFYKALKQENARAERHKTQVSLYHVFFRLCSKPIFYAGVLRFCADTLGFVGPIAINALVNYATSLQSDDPNFYP